MTINTAKRRMLEGKPAIGAEAGLGSALSAEMLSRLGFDWVMVDNQHGGWDETSSMTAFKAIALGSATPMARVRQNNFSAIGQLLDRGALGIVVPMVNSVEEAREAARAVRYPPRGGRSGGAFGTAHHGDDYMSWIDDEVFLAVQIETAPAVEHAEEIMAVEGVDGCWVGPGDLRFSMGVDIDTPAGKKAHEEAIVSVVEACRKTGKIAGISAQSTEMAQHWFDKGMLFVTTGADSEWAEDGARNALSELRAAN